MIQSYECTTGMYFDEGTNQCVSGTWFDDTEHTSINVVDDPCIGTYDGFAAIDSYTYTECFNYTEVGRYNCPDGFFYQEMQQQCMKGDESGGETDSLSTVGIVSNSTGVTEVLASCNNVSSGNVPLSSLKGWLVCSDGSILSTIYCGSSKLYDVSSGICINYCESSSLLNTNSMNTTTMESLPSSSFVLPRLAGKITCDSASSTSIDSIICAQGTHYDVDRGYCRNHCEGTLQKYVPFPGVEGGATCENGIVLATEWCLSGSLYSIMRGACTETDSPTLSPMSGYPTEAPVSIAPTVSPSVRATISSPPTFNMTEEVRKQKKPGIVNVPDNGAFEPRCTVGFVNFAWVYLMSTIVIGIGGCWGLY